MARMMWGLLNRAIAEWDCLLETKTTAPRNPSPLACFFYIHRLHSHALWFLFYFNPLPLQVSASAFTAPLQFQQQTRLKSAASRRRGRRLLCCACFTLFTRLCRHMLSWGMHRLLRLLREILECLKLSRVF